MKAITPVLSLILLIIIVIVVIGFSFGFFGNLVSSLTQTSQEQVETQSEQMNVCFRIEAASGDTIYVRNCGSSPISEFVVMSEEGIVPVTNSPTIDPGKVGEVKIDTSSLSQGEHKFTVSVGFIENSVTFTPSGGGDNPPLFNSFYPENNIIDINQKDYTTTNVTFSCNVTDDKNITLIEIYTNETGSFTSLCQQTPNVQAYELSCKKELPEGYYEWYCNTTDNASQISTSEHKTFEVNKAPIIYNVNNNTGSNPGDFLVFWNTDEASSCTFEYGQDESYGTSLNTPESTTHFISQTADPETWYYFRINCTNETDNDVGHYTGKVFSGPSPPKLMNINSIVETNSANITWVTDELADSLVIYSTDPDIPPINSPTKSDLNYVLNHKIQLTGLSAGTTYYYKVKSTDIYGASNTSTVYSFTLP